MRCSRRGGAATPASLVELARCDLVGANRARRPGMPYYNYYCSSWLRNAVAAIAAVLLALTTASSALAQVDEGFSAQNFQAPMDPYGYVTLNGARTLRAGHPFFGAYIDWSQEPLDLRDIK